jgi:hypothetical protein
LLSAIPKPKRGKAIVVGLACLGAIILVINAIVPSHESNNVQESVIPPVQPPPTEVPPSVDSNSGIETMTPPTNYDPTASQEVGVGTKNGLSLAELAAMIGYQLPKGETASYYSKEIRAGVVAFDPNYQLTSYDEATIDSTASILAGK